MSPARCAAGGISLVLVAFLDVTWSLGGGPPALRGSSAVARAGDSCGDLDDEPGIAVGDVLITLRTVGGLLQYDPRADVAHPFGLVTVADSLRLLQTTIGVMAPPPECGGQGTDDCGNGTLDADEECDDGPANSNTRPNACREDCTLPRCGDGVVDTENGEGCEPGNDICPVGAMCFPNCRCVAPEASPTCGNGEVDDPGEQCDAGLENSNEPNAPCRANCLVPRCGDGVLDDEREDCDPGLGGVSDACGTQALCIVPECECRQTACGNGVVETFEECDAGADNSDEPDAPCRTNCTLPRCGDGVLDSVDEECEPEVAPTSWLCLLNDEVTCGLPGAANGCECVLSPTVCGDGFVSEVEFCDPGTSADRGDDIGCTRDDFCATVQDAQVDDDIAFIGACTCVAEVCGDGQVTGLEDCESHTDCALGGVCGPDCFCD